MDQEKPENCDDCAFVFGEEEIKARKLLLAYHSPVFEKMFFGKMASDRVVINDITPKEFRQMLKFVDTEKVRIQSVLNAWSLFYVAHKYLLHGLVKVCVDYIQKNLSINTLALSYEYAEMYELVELQKICMIEIISYVRGLFHCDYHMKSSTIVIILEQPFLNISNNHLVKDVLNWAVTECDINKIDVSTDNVMNLLNSTHILQYLVNLSLSVDFKSDNFVVSCCEIISKMRPMVPRKNYSNKHWCIFSKCRQAYKIAGRIELRGKNVFVSNISANRNALLYGLVLVTADDAAVSKIQQTISINIQICPIDNSESVNTTTFTKTSLNEVLTYIPLSELMYLERDKIYLITISYTILHKREESGRTSVVCNYMGSRLIDEKKKIVFSFNELNGSIIRGISYYPV